MKKSKILIDISILFVLYLSIILIYFNLNIKENLYIYFTNFCILSLSSVFMIFGDKYNYSLNKFFYIFCFFFLGVAPILQYSNNIVLWKDDVIFENDYIKMNIILIFIILTYQFFYFIFSRLKKNFLEKFILFKFSIKDKKIRKNILFLISFLVLFYTLYRINFKVEFLFFKNFEKSKLLSNFSQINNLIYNNFIQLIPLISLYLFKKFNIENKKEEIILIILFLLTNFPITLSRYAIARNYIIFFILYFKILKKYFILNFTMIFGLLYLFPFFNQFRSFEGINKIQLSLDFSMFLEGHFDSYQNFLRVVSNGIITNGNQLLGVILFWFPRNIWQNKPIGSGAYLASKINLIFNNIAMNYFGEGYINFGYIGIFIFVIFIAYVNARFDKLYWENKNDNYFEIMYLFLLGLEIFILRGDLMSSFAYAIGNLCSSIFLYLILIKNKFRIE